jgi:hypothetical protein
MPLGPRFAYAARRRRLPRAVIVPHLHSVAFIATTLERMMRQGSSVTTDRLQVAAEALRATEANEPDDIYATLKARLLNTHGIRIKRRTIEKRITSVGRHMRRSDNDMDDRRVSG